MPVLHARRRPDHITRLDLPLLAAFFLNPTRPGCDDEYLAGGMGMPGGPSPRREDHMPTRRRCVIVRCVEGLDDHASSEIHSRSWGGGSGTVRRDDRAL